MLTRRNANGMSRRDVIRLASATGVAAGLYRPQMIWAAAPVQIPVGQIAPFTGSAAEYGPYYRDAAKLAFEQINQAAEKVFGGPIIGQHVVADSNTLPGPAVAAARKMVEVDRVPAIIAEWSSGATVAIAASVTIPAGVLQIANGASSPLITVLPEDEEADLLFRTSPSDALQGVVAADLAAGNVIDDYRFSRVATIYINNPYGQGLSNAFTEAFERRGGKVLQQVAHPEEMQATYKAQIEAALKGDPELILAASYPAHTAAFVREARDNFDFTAFQYCDANRGDEVLKEVGADALRGRLGTVPSADPESPTFRKFRDGFLERFDYDTLQPYTETTYDAAMVIGLTIAKAIADGKKGDEITGRILADNLREVSNPPGERILAGDLDSIAKGMQLIADGKDVDYVGAGGEVDFDAAGDVRTPYAVWRWTDTGSEDIHLIPASEVPAE